MVLFCFFFGFGFFWSRMDFYIQNYPSCMDVDLRAKPRKCLLLGEQGVERGVKKERRVGRKGKKGKKGEERGRKGEEVGNVVIFSGGSVRFWFEWLMFGLVFIRFDLSRCKHFIYFDLSEELHLPFFLSILLTAFL